jgi:hypothetical protein
MPHPTLDIRTQSDHSRRSRSPNLNCEEPSTPSSMASSASRRKQGKNKVSQTNGHVQLPERRAAPRLPPLLTYYEIPAWYQDNEHIHGSYRPVLFSISACFASWAYIHNETFNIYSHLISATFFLLGQIMFSHLISQHFPEAKAGDYIIFSFFLLTAFITLSISFTYHTLMNHSLRMSHLWLRIDYAGIICLTLGDFVSGIYLVFYCEPGLQKLYWIMVCSARTFTPHGLRDIHGHSAFVIPLSLCTALDRLPVWPS